MICKECHQFYYSDLIYIFQHFIIKNLDKNENRMMNHHTHLQQLSMHN